VKLEPVEGFADGPAVAINNDPDQILLIVGYFRYLDVVFFLVFCREKRSRVDPDTKIPIFCSLK
jgi:hypothetical protein